jgi:uncharacterized delta-60 repeat protein
VHRALWLSAIALSIALLLTPGAVWAHDSGFGLVRYLSDGNLDPSFGTNGTVVIRSARRSFVANALALQPDGKVLLAGLNSETGTGAIDLAIARYDANGAPDATFSSDGIVTTPVGDLGAQANTMALQSDGAVVVAGTAYSRAAPDKFLLARFSPNGALDSTFGTAGLSTMHVGADAASAAAMALQPDGAIVVAGTAFSNGATDDDFAVARYLPNGEADPRFGVGGVVTTDFGSADSNASLDRAGAVFLQADNKILVAGFTRGIHQSFAVARYNSDGTLDSTFGQDGKVQVPAVEPQVYAIAMQPSGEIVLAGSSASSSRGTAAFTLVRLHPDGTPDLRFGTGGLVTTSFEGSRSGARAVVSQLDGKMVIGGAKFGAPSATGDALPESGFALTRYNSDGSIDSTFGTGGRALTSLGDAGATPLALAVQPDGKILAAGLVFFQVVPPTAPDPFGITRVVVAIAATVIGGLAAVLVLVRRMPGSRKGPPVPRT